MSFRGDLTVRGGVQMSNRLTEDSDNAQGIFIFIFILTRVVIIMGAEHVFTPIVPPTINEDKYDTISA